MAMSNEESSSAISRDIVLNLIEQKDKIEREIAALFEILEQNMNIGMNGPLVDLEGFPRNDIDVYQVRHARHKIICLQNDHKAIMTQIEGGIHGIHAQIRDSGSQMDWVADDTPGDPFVRVNFVAAGSPAFLAGLEVEDQFVQFGSLNSNNFNSLQDVATIVQHSVNQEILIKVKRRGQYLNLKLIPKTWSGRGLLGCNILPLESVER